MSGCSSSFDDRRKPPVHQRFALGAKFCHSGGFDGGFAFKVNQHCQLLALFGAVVEDFLEAFHYPIEGIVIVVVHDKVGGIAGTNFNLFFE